MYRSFAKTGIVILVIATAPLLCCIPGSAVMAKSYRITAVDIDAQLHADGSMSVVETRDYKFKGPFSFAYRDLPTWGAVSFDDFSVAEGGHPYRQSTSQEPGTYTVVKIPDRTRVTWYYRAEDESRSFEFRYRARDAVRRYEDAAVLYYKFLSEDWETPQDNISLSLRPPVPVARVKINEWLHGPLQAQSQISHDGRILAQCPHLPGNTYLEIRALYPPELFAETPSRSGQVRERIMAEEARWAEEANRRREAAARRLAARAQRLRFGRYIVVAVSLVGLLAWWLLYQKYHRKPQLPTFLEITSEIPEQTPPALVGYLLNSRRVSGGALIGTMLDLARRGLVNLREESEEVKRFWGGTRKSTEYYWDLDRSKWDRSEADMLDFEKSLIRFIFDDLAEGADSISLDKIKKKRRAFTKFFGQWKTEVERTGSQRGWFDTRSIRGMYYSLAVGGSMVGLAVVSMILIGPWGMVLGAAAVAVVVLSFFIGHRTAEGETKARHWKAVQKYLRKYEFRNADRRDILSRISDYLVYGVVLGLSTKLYEELATYIPEGEHLAYIPWYIYGGHGSGQFSPAAFGDAFSSMVATATSAMSTAAGTGGGASAGGGGGASSGGGGAG